MWHRIADWVMRRPVLVLLPSLALLLAAGLAVLPLVGLPPPTSRTLPRGIEARDVYEELRQAFPDQARTRLLVVARYPTEPAYTPERVGPLYELAQRLARAARRASRWRASSTRILASPASYFEADAETPSTSCRIARGGCAP